MWLARAGSAGLAIMMFLTLADVIGRMFDNPIVGTVEVTELIMGMMIYLGVGYTTIHRGHIRVDILITRFSPRVQATLDTITFFIAFVFMGKGKASPNGDLCTYDTMTTKEVLFAAEHMHGAAFTP